MPVLPKDLTPGELYDAATRTPENIVGMLFEADALERFNGSVLDFSGCVFRNVIINACEVDRIYLMDCRFERCDLSGFHFRDGAIRRTAFAGCRLSGANLDHMSLRDVTFEECPMEFAEFVNCKLNEVSLKGCRLDHGLMSGCAQKGLMLRDCDLSGLEIAATRLRDVDLSTCKLDGLRATIQALEGATLGLHQAPIALNLCGVTVKM